MNDTILVSRAIQRQAVIVAAGRNPYLALKNLFNAGFRGRALMLPVAGWIGN